MLNFIRSCFFKSELEGISIEAAKNTRGIGYINNESQYTQRG